MTKKLKNRKPRLAFREQRNGIKRYFVEVWACYESGCMWSQESREIENFEDAKKVLKEISDKKIIGYGIIK